MKKEALFTCISSFYLLSPIVTARLEHMWWGEFIGGKGKGIESEDSPPLQPSHT